MLHSTNENNVEKQIIFINWDENVMLIIETFYSSWEWGNFSFNTSFENIFEIFLFN
jgi:hypothetical protein